MSWLPRPAEGKAWVAPSVLSADFAGLEADLGSMATAGAHALHLDVMDGHFVPNITFGPFICAALRRLSDLPLDAHLMISRPDRYLEPFAKSGIDGLTIHVEAEAEIAPTLARIGALGMKRGISLNPDTDLQEILPFLGQVDLVLVMIVQPGFGVLCGRTFQPKLALRRRRD